MSGWEAFPRWYGWRTDDEPMLLVHVWCPLRLLEYNRYGCRVLPAAWQM